MAWKYNTPDELYHYGVLGMKWGHHKSKNYNGPALLVGKKKRPILGFGAFNTKGADKRKKAANDKVAKINNTKPGSKKYVKAKLKATKINSSRYGKTNGRLLAEGIVKDIATAAIGNSMCRSLSKRGHTEAAKVMRKVGNTLIVANAVNTGVRIHYNYRDKYRKNN